ncbi:unnamed protein product [Musa hybrid cultivar]
MWMFYHQGCPPNQHRQMHEDEVESVYEKRVHDLESL